MKKGLLISSAIFAAITAVNANDDTPLDHLVSFDRGPLTSISRNAKEVSDASMKTNFFTYGPAKLVEGRFEKALDFSDTKSRVEGRFLLGSTYYNPHVATVGFWIQMPKESFGVKGKKSTIFEEKGEQSSLSLTIDEQGRLHLEGVTLYQGKLLTFDDYLSEKQQNMDSDLLAEIEVFRKSKGIPAETALNEQDQQLIENRILARYRKEAEALLEEQSKVGNLRPVDFDYLCDPIANVTKWKLNEWRHIAVTWNSYEGIYAVYLDSKLVMRVDGDKKLGGGMREGAGSHIVFGPGKDGFSAVIDDFKVKKELTDAEFDLTQF
jgi:hypothetical protein